MGINWYLINADNQVLGRLATRVATLLMGKERLDFSPNVNCGDHVVVVNAARIRVTGNKAQDKKYRRHSGYLGGLKEISYEKLLAKKPEKVIEFAVRGMLPQNRLSRQVFKNLKVYAGTEHPHAAQNPVEIKL
ncbi:MAG TPA: 50S ribosomal protein L13 [bacterium]|uniref:Large ribosomal subunit protein uL13 n=1 Tax=candidate division TA06 bacterium ADurb.Bin417 TaxID=1852828 RepID=A0A1V5MF35_UNCT6|nr:MAG: 50S ribosomal protein L13 [candidate division TA06 bacterium ADurb.Bin417]HNQ35684.1 50S ribosomal protein L13 [bacterium]HNS48777.1 50S ribosomal protein L13 [bacterium]